MQQDKREYQKVIEYLRNMISKGELKIGSKIPTERELADILLISRNSTREALRTLENMGVIESRRGSGNYIKGNMEKSLSSMTDMMLLLKQTNQDEICSFRRSLDKAVCLTLLDENVNSKIIEKIEAQYNKAKNSEIIDVLIENDRIFHYSLIKATGNQLWISIAEAIMKVYRSWIDNVLKNASEQTIATLSDAHKQIIESLKNNDRIECEKWIDRHYDIVDNEMKRGHDHEI